MRGTVGADRLRRWSVSAASATHANYSANIVHLPPYFPPQETHLARDPSTCVQDIATYYPRSMAYRHGCDQRVNSRDRDAGASFEWNRKVRHLCPTDFCLKFVLAVLDVANST